MTTVVFIIRADENWATRPLIMILMDLGLIMFAKEKGG
jgi:hypothetical protein